MSEDEASLSTSINQNSMNLVETSSEAMNSQREEEVEPRLLESKKDNHDQGADPTGNGGSNEDDASDSGKESVESDESSFHASDYENDSGYDPAKDPTELMAIASAFKETGNDYFKNGDLVRACRSYKKGVSVLKPLQSDEKHSHDESVKSLIVTISNNLSMLCLQQGKPKLSIDVAAKAIAVDDSNAKAYFRRAMGYKKLGMLREAKNDLKLAYQCDPANKAVQKELHGIVKHLRETQQRQKKAAESVFSFNKKTMSLYDDKHAEEQRKKEERERKKREEDDLLAQRKREWEEDCAQKRSLAEENGGNNSHVGILTFDEWEKQRKKKEKAARKAQRALAEEKRKAEEKAKMERLAKKKKEEERRAQEATEEVDDDDDEKITESELSQFRGYKKTPHGTMTSYFTRHASEDDIKIIGDITPRRLNENGEPIDSTGPAKISMNNNSTTVQDCKRKTSAWNVGGTTWEETNASDWATAQLRRRLQETTVMTSSKESLVGTVSSVSDLLGEASVAVASGKKRYIFDYHCQLEFEIRDDVDDLVASGILRLPDLNSGNCAEFEVEVDAWKIPPREDWKDLATEVREDLIKAVRGNVQNFVNDFIGHY